MPNNNEYYDKYYKYKNKYLSIKNEASLSKQIGGEDPPINIYEDLNALYKYFFIKNSILKELLSKGKLIGLTKSDKNYYTFSLESFFEILDNNAYIVNYFTKTLLLVTKSLYLSLNNLDNINYEMEEQHKQNEIKEKKEKKLFDNIKMDQNNDPNQSSGFYLKASFINPQTSLLMAEVINKSKAELRKLYSENGVCDYMIKQISNIENSFVNEIDLAYTKAMLNIDSIIENKKLCLQQIINFNQSEQFTTLTNKDALMKLKKRVDTAFYESYLVAKNDNSINKNNLELTSYVIQTLVNFNKNIIILVEYIELPNDNSVEQQYRAPDNEVEEVEEEQ